MDLKNPFALFENRIISIYDLDESNRGLKCNCICPNCKAPFEARMGEIRQWHFAHSGTPCDSVKLHVNACYLFARQILLDKGILRYPGLNSRSNHIFNSGIIRIDNIEISYNKDELAIGLIINDKDLAIRLLLDVDYCVDEIKKPLRDLSTLLIDFRGISKANTETISIRLCEELYGKTWIYSIAQKRHNEAIRKASSVNDISVNDYEPKNIKTQKEYSQPMVFCKLCKRTVHKDDAMWAKNHHGFICHECIESNSLNWRVI